VEEEFTSYWQFVKGGLVMIKKSLKAGAIDEKGIRNKCGGSRCQRVELVEQYRKL